MIQTLTVDLIVAAAALWLVWSFAPAGLRRWCRRAWLRRDHKVAVKPVQDCTCGVGGTCDSPGSSLHAEELGG